jgi:hypothetical protein
MFTAEDLIYCYTDADALADGVLVDITAADIVVAGLPLNRVTAAVWATLTAAATALQKEPLEVLRQIIPGLVQDARGRADLIVIDDARGELWIRRNETGGQTLMYPSDN